MTKWTLPEGRKPLTDADMAALTHRLADTAIEQSELYQAAKRDAEEAEAYAAELEATLAKAVNEKLDAISTLDAWFDRRKLSHDAVDQAVVDAASGYLRTSRVGGMPKEESDLILGVIQDMARLSLFADLFARTTLAELKEGRG